MGQPLSTTVLEIFNTELEMGIFHERRLKSIL